MSGTVFGEFADLSAMLLIGALVVTMEPRRFIPMGLPRLTLCFVGLSVFAIQIALVYASNIF